MTPCYFVLCWLHSALESESGDLGKETREEESAIFDSTPDFFLKINVCGSLKLFFSLLLSGRAN